MRFIFTMALAFGLTTTADAGLILQASNLDLKQGETGIVTVTLQNTGPAAVDLAGYQVQMALSLAGVQFVGVERTAPLYLFPGATGPISSDFDPPFFAPPVTQFTATDFTVSLLGFDTLEAGETIGILQIGVAADPFAPPDVSQSVRFVQPGTGLTDLTQLINGAGNLIPFTAVDGRVAVIPEPVTLVALGIFALGAVWLRR